MSKRGALWNYLKESGVLEYGSAEDIAKARLEFTRKRDREYKARRRAVYHEHLIRLTSKEHERVGQEAKRYNISIPDFVRKSSLAYLDQVFVVPDAQKKIESLLTRSLTAIERTCARDAKSWFARGNDFEELKKIIFEIRDQMRRELCNPDPLLKAVLNNKERWDELKKIMSDDFKDTGDQD